MRLADFILGNIEPILAEWEVFARSILPGARLDTLALRDHAQDILRATVRDMRSTQSGSQQSDKSKGVGDAGAASARLTGASVMHAVGRVDSGFGLEEMVSEYRALRASVIRLWRESLPNPDLSDIDDLTRFNEAIDQSLTDAVRSYSQRVDQSRQMFLAILGHDLRNPLNAIGMSAELLRMSGRPGDETSQAADQITTSVTAISRMLHDLLDFTSARLGSGLPVFPAPADLRQLCQEVVDECRAAHPECRINFHSTGDATGSWDAARLRQVISNLLGNAIQHGRENCQVDLALHANPSDVILTVHNDGTPIPPDLLSTIFDTFVPATPAGSARPRRPGSIGLGLFIAQGIAISHGGSIEVASSAQAGTVFTVRLPRNPAP
jgi:signal transduction histidine kinase